MQVQNLICGVDKKSVGENDYESRESGEDVVSAVEDMTTVSLLQTPTL